MGNIGKSSLGSLRLCNKYICLDSRCIFILIFLFIIGIIGLGSGLYFNKNLGKVMRKIDSNFKYLKIFSLLNGTHKIFNYHITGWIISHFLLYLIIGLICSTQFILFFVIGVLWEIIEYVIVYITDETFWTNNTHKFQYGDIIANTLGYLSGSVLNRLMFRK